jgi:hypothetical protein
MIVSETSICIQSCSRICQQDLKDLMKTCQKREVWLKHIFDFKEFPDGGRLECGRLNEEIDLAADETLDMWKQKEMLLTFLRTA